jgi:alpha-beta hydrolase superfamily lysophospholipase
VNRARAKRAVSAGRIVGSIAIVVGAAATLGALAGAAIAVVFARKVVTPPSAPNDDTRILGHDDSTLTLARTIDSLTPGRYGFWFRHDTGHARVGEILEVRDDAVVRRLLAVDFGELSVPSRGRFSGWFYLKPGDLGVPYQDIEIRTPIGPAPAWAFPAGADADRWVIAVHGRSVTRREALRAVPVFRESGWNTLIVSYRNDGEAPRTDDHRYALGDTEWLDVEAAMQYAIDHGARQLVLLGYSMGGATVLQAVTRSPLATWVRGIVLDSPVVDWVAALHYQGVVYRLPRALRLATMRVLTQQWGRILTGQAEPIDLDRLDIVRRANELKVPILLLHSDDDGYIPSTASRSLALARPDIVTFEAFDTARHTRLWNYDPERWNGAIRAWLLSLPLESPDR